jgi:hypothetical protein
MERMASDLCPFTSFTARPYSLPSLLLRACQADRHRSSQLRSFSRRALKRSTHLFEQSAVRLT